MSDAAETTTPPAESKAPDLVKAVESLVAKHGDSSAALRVLLAENYAYRDQLRDAKAKLPADGSVVLTGDDAKQWDAYRGLGKPEDVRKTVREHGEQGTRLAGLERDETLRGVAEKAGVKFAVLKRLAGSAEFVAAKATDAKTGKEREVVTVKDGDAEPIPFDDYFADFLSSLRAEAAPPPSAPGAFNTPTRSAPRESPYTIPERTAPVGPLVSF